MSRWMSVFLGSCLSLVLCIFLSCSFQGESAAQSDAEKLLEKSGVVMQKPPAEYSDKFAESVIEEVLPTVDIIRLVPPSARLGKAEAILFDYGARGRSLSFQRALDLNTLSTVELLIEREEDIRLRHTINIGTDRAKWETIRKETTWPNDNPFKRTYLLVQSRGEKARMAGLAYFKGAKVAIETTGPVNNATIKTLETITWATAARLESIYNDRLKAVSEGPLFKENPYLTRPDLPDPDK